jgi:FKBP-type peptidyl-prolyl cis-trans isomerase FklB
MRLLTIAATGLVLFGCQSPNPDAAKEFVRQSEKITKSHLDDVTKLVSYSIGHNLGENLKEDNVELDYLALVKGIEDGKQAKERLITMEETQEAMQAFQQMIQDKKFGPNKKAGEDFLAENAKREGVVVLPSGLQYEVITTGEGPKPVDGDVVVSNYKGTFIDGSLFDSNEDRGEPVEFPVNGVIAGWTEALKLMNAGSKWKLYVPYSLAYGERGYPMGRNMYKIEPFTTLVFEVELLEVKKSPINDDHFGHNH